MKAWGMRHQGTSGYGKVPSLPSQIPLYPQITVMHGWGRDFNIPSLVHRSMAQIVWDPEHLRPWETNNQDISMMLRSLQVPRPSLCKKQSLSIGLCLVVCKATVFVASWATCGVITVSHMTRPSLDPQSVPSTKWIFNQYQWRIKMLFGWWKKV